ncbi:MAG TPA: hypothetical protein PKA00_06095 [Saprospiraceae bacterium]|nr:hypothetical protein [Saprospiraceae bacterium]HMQ82455.1 hypothetical protein [Saprospiraceae bacterium]
MEKDIFHETLLKEMQASLNSREVSIFLDNKKRINEGLEYGRAGVMDAAFQQFEAVESNICSLPLSYPCRLLIMSFYNSGLAYLRVKANEPEEANRLCLQALFINNYLIQAHGFNVLEIHRVQQMANLARILFRSGQKEQAFNILFALLGCFEQKDNFPLIYSYNRLEMLHDEYRSTGLTTNPIGRHHPSSQLHEVYQTPVTRFGKRSSMKATDITALFLLNFSKIPSELLERMLAHLIEFYIDFSKGLDNAAQKAIFNRHGIYSDTDLKGWEAYQSAYLFLKIKVHFLNKEFQDFLNALKSFSQNVSQPSIWNAILMDFHSFCQTSGMEDSKMKVDLFEQSIIKMST